MHIPILHHTSKHVHLFQLNFPAHIILTSAYNLVNPCLSLTGTCCPLHSGHNKIYIQIFLALHLTVSLIQYLGYADKLLID